MTGLSFARPATSRCMSASGMWRAPGMWPASYSTSVRTSISWLPESMICLASAGPTSGMARQLIQLQEARRVAFRWLNVRENRWPIQVWDRSVDAVTVNARRLNVVGEKQEEIPFELDAALTETVSLGAS